MSKACIHFRFSEGSCVKATMAVLVALAVVHSPRDVWPVFGSGTTTAFFRNECHGVAPPTVVPRANAVVITRALRLNPFAWKCAGSECVGELASAYRSTTRPRARRALNLKEQADGDERFSAHRVPTADAPEAGLQTASITPRSVMRRDHDRRPSARCGYHACPTVRTTRRS